MTRPSLASLRDAIITLLIMLPAAFAAAQTADFDPAEHSTFATTRPDGRYVSSRAIAHRLMLSQPPRLHYDSATVGSSPARFAQWQQEMSQAMTRLMNHPDVTGQPAPRLTSSEQLDGYTLQRWEAYPLPEAVVPFLVMVPDGVDAAHPAPAIMCIPGFGQTKELLATGPKGMAYQYVKEGYVAVVVDNPGCGEEGDLEAIAGGRADYVTLSRALLELSWSYLGYASYVDMTILQWMKTQPEMRRDRLVVSGFSLGTEPLMALGLMDSEIYAFVYNDFLCTTRERALVMTLPDESGARPWPNDISHLIPGFLTEFDFPDIVAALAPRPVICTEGGMDRDFQMVAGAFAAAGAPDNFKAYHYLAFQDEDARRYLDEMPEGIDRATFFRLANVDPPHHYFKAEYVLPWLRTILTD